MNIFRRTDDRALELSQEDWRDIATLVAERIEVVGPDEQLERLEARIQEHIDSDGNDRRDDWLATRRRELEAESPEPLSPGDGVGILTQAVWAEDAAEMRAREELKRQ